MKEEKERFVTKFCESGVPYVSAHILHLGVEEEEEIEEGMSLLFVSGKIIVTQLQIQRMKAVPITGVQYTCLS